MTFLWVCLAGGLGSGARYLVGLATARITTAFPYGTLTVNILGCFLIALVLQAPLSLLSPTQKLILATGFLGGFTTYSSFNYDALRFINEGAPAKAAAYVVTTTVACALAGIAGFALAKAYA